MTTRQSRSLVLLLVATLVAPVAGAGVSRADGCTVGVVLKPYAVNPAVPCLEQRMAELGYTVGSVDTYYDPTTVKAVKAYQATRGLYTDGIVTSIVARQLGLRGSLPAGPTVSKVTVIGDSTSAAMRWYDEANNVTTAYDVMGNHHDLVWSIESCRRLVATSCRGRVDPGAELGELLIAEFRPATAGEHLDDLGLHRLDVLDLDAHEFEHDLRRHADALELGERPQRVEVVRVVVALAELLGVAEQPLGPDRGDDPGVEPRPFDEVGEGVGERSRALEHLRHEVRPAVGVEQGPDRGEREPLGLEVADALEPFEVLGAVDLGAPDPRGRGEEALALVEADRVDGQARLAGEVVDPPLGGLGRHGSSVGRGGSPGVVKSVTLCE